MKREQTSEHPQYEILELLGEGALASVYRVRSRKDGSVRALKELRPEQARVPDTIRRFEDEYRILSTLHHPSLPEVYDYGAAADGTPYMVMDLVEGAPLDAYIRENPDDLWTILFQLNEALAFIHEHNLLHLDLKPSNILVRRTRIFGETEMPLAVLIDFGLSYRRELGGEVKLTGTAGYMAPEIIRGEANLTRAVDYYSLGVIIYELVEGEAPFRGSVEEVLRAHLSRAVEFEKRKVEYAELHPWVEKLMAKEPRGRLEAFGEFRRAVAARLGEGVGDMERVFALGYIDSLGLTGKEEAWDELRVWAAKLGERLAARTAALPGDRARDAEATLDAEPPAAPQDVLGGSATGLEKRIEEDLLSRAARPVEKKIIDDIPRVLAVSGPPESGKSHVVSSLRNELLVRGVRVVQLGRESDYPRLVLTDDPRPRRSRARDVDPESLVIDRFVAAWNRLAEMGKRTGVIVLVDDLARASAEEKEFVEYAGKRMGHELASRSEPGVFIVVVGPSRDVKKALAPVAAREGSLSAVEIPPPGKQEADDIAARFRGQLSGAREEKSLSTYLQTNLETWAGLYAALKQSIAAGALVHEHGRWHFREQIAPTRKTAVSTLAYYQSVFLDLPEAAKAMVGALACHPAPLSVDELASITGLSGVEVEAAIDALRPLRVIEIAETAEGRRIEIISDQVRDGFRSAIRKREREAIHARLVDYFKGRPEETVGYFETMAYHCERLGLTRNALVMRLRAIGLAGKRRDVFALRRVCGAGIEYSRTLRSREWKGRKGHIERYFIKQWMDAEWLVSSYAGLVKVVEDNYTRKRREIPVSFLYKYATALERVGRIEDCKRVLAEGKRRAGNERSETHQLLLLEEGSMLAAVGELERALAVLDSVQSESLGMITRASLYGVYIRVYLSLGKNRSAGSYIKKTEELPNDFRLIDRRLRIEYVKVGFLLMEGRYQSARHVIGRGIRLAILNKAYRGLASMYFIASNLYYDLGEYQKTLVYLDKTIRLAKEKSASDRVHEYEIRYVLIYAKLGLLGSAIERAEAIVQAAESDRKYHAQYFTALTVLMDRLVSINSSVAHSLAVKLVRESARVEAKERLALYHRALARYYRMNSDYRRAILEFENARDLFSVMRMVDEQIVAGLAVASLMILNRKLDEAWNLIVEAQTAIGTMESSAVRAKYCVTELKYHIAVKASHRTISECIERCEAIRRELRDVESAMEVDAELFKGLLGIGDQEKAMVVFDRYYNQLRRVAGTLAPEYMSDYMMNGEVREVIGLYKTLITPRPKPTT